jgi:hypothetical protein
LLKVNDTCANSHAIHALSTAFADAHWGLGQSFVISNEDLYDGHIRPSKYGKIWVTTSHLPAIVVTSQNVHQYSIWYPYDGTIHTVLTVYSWHP